MFNFLKNVCKKKVQHVGCWMPKARYFDELGLYDTDKQKRDMMNCKETVKGDN